MEIDWLKYENEAKALRYSLIAGVDEAGRGPLAGPVVAAAVILIQDVNILGVNDSKKLSEKARQEIYQQVICHENLLYGVGVVEADVIDELNILNATFLAMKKAVEALPEKPDFLLIDGNQSPKIPIPTRTIIKGDALSKSIALASIIAKVTRDEIMKKLDAKMPQYQFLSHKGYPTSKHKQLIEKFGLSDQHRKSFKCTI